MGSVPEAPSRKEANGATCRFSTPAAANTRLSRRRLDQAVDGLPEAEATVRG